jgi:AraC-like DNA-binding protein
MKRHAPAPSITAGQESRTETEIPPIPICPTQGHRRASSTRQRSSPTPPKLILHSHELPGCPRLRSLFERSFETDVVETAAEFSARLRRRETDAIVLCFCSAADDGVDFLLRVVALAGPIPTLACCRKCSPTFIHLAASRGVTHFLLCEMEEEAIRRFVFRTIRVGGLREFLESQCPAGRRSSPHASRLVNDITQTFPRRLTTDEASRRLGISTRRLQTICRETFSRSFTHLLRLIWVHQALTMMQNTCLDNTEIALRLGYEDESSLARIFRKELGYSPSEARRLLAGQTPNGLLQERRPGA